MDRLTPANSATLPLNDQELRIDMQLAEELSRRLQIPGQAELLDTTMDPEPPRFFCEARHGLHEAEGQGLQTIDQGAKRMQKERLKTTAVALVLCLNIGVDPPDVIRLSPCARMECWVDPMSMQAPKALETIGSALQAQYERWQPRAKYKKHLDPTLEDVKKLATSCRRAARNERVLFHYNGHGVPRPTTNGEVWVFNKSYTQYIPLSMYDLQTWVGAPCIYVLDCSAAGLLLPSFQTFAQLPQEGDVERERDSASSQASGEEAAADCILLGACGPSEVLPQNPELPADIFTACLTTPVRVALRWFFARSLVRQQGLTREHIDRIPGKQTDRKTPLGELNWIFTAVTDTIAWNLLPRALFQRLFRQDLMVASLFRNFLLAERVMRSYHCRPVSLPRLPPTHQHPLWAAWDMAAELVLLQLPQLLGGGQVEFQPSQFFTQQLTAFELWLQHGSRDKRPPEQLPIVLQVLLSQVHRLRALVLLARFLDMGAWAADLALSTGIYPYVLKLLQTTAAELRPILVFIWAKILASDPSCQVDLVKDEGHLYFIRFLSDPEEGTTAQTRAQAAFVLATICVGVPQPSRPAGSCDPAQQRICWDAGLARVLVSNLAARGELRGAASSPLLIRWLCLCLGRLVQDNPLMAAAVAEQGAVTHLSDLLHSVQPEIRASAAFALCCLIQSAPHEGGNGEGEHPPGGGPQLERELACYLLELTYDASPLVRAQVALGLARISLSHPLLFQDAVQVLRRAQHQMLTSLREAAAKLAAAAAREPPRKGTSAERTRSMTSDILHHGSPGPSNGAKSYHPSNSLPSSPAWRPAVLGGSGSDHGLRGSSNDHTSPSSPRLAGSSPGSPTSQSGMQHSSSSAAYASLDAARVGEGLYPQLVEAACLLAIDPSPRVAHAGRMALRTADVELIPVSTAASSAPASSLAPAPSAPLGHGMFGSMDLAISQLQSMPSGFLDPASQSHGNLPELGTAPTAPQRNAAPSGFSRFQRSFKQSLASLASSGGSASPPSSPTAGSQLPPTLPRCAYLLSPVKTNGPRRPQAREAQPQLPSSLVWDTSCQQLAAPLLDAQGASICNAGTPRMPDFAQASPARTARRVMQQGSARQKYRGAQTGFHLEQRYMAEMRQPGEQSTSAVLWHPFRNELVTCNSLGHVQVTKFARAMVRPNEDRSEAAITLGSEHSFHVANGAAPGAAAAASPCNVVSMWHLNSVYAANLLAASADGAVRVWRNHTFRTQRLSTAWQAVPITPGCILGGALQPATFECSELHGALFASGGTQPTIVQQWDMHREQLSQHLELDAENTVVTHLAASQQQATIAAGCSNGCLQLFDLRAGRSPVSTFTPQPGPMIGLALEPGRQAQQAVSASVDGSIHLSDLRVVGGPSQQDSPKGVWRTLRADPKGRLSCLAVHHTAPLIAAGSSTVLKLWNARGEEQGHPIKVRTKILAPNGGPITRLAFHPHKAQLAAAFGDGSLTLFNIAHANDSQQGAMTPSLLLESPAG